MTQTRFRRPVPERTTPKRGVLGAFGQKEWGQNEQIAPEWGAQPTGHPLGLGGAETDTPFDFLVDLAGTLKDYLTRAAAAPAAPQGAHHAAPALSLRVACPVEVRIEMFRPAMALSAQPLGSDDPAQPARITEVSVTNNRLCISVPQDQPPGTYYGLLIEDGQGPAGVVTLDVLPEGAI